MVSRLVCLLALASLCLSSPLGGFGKELEKQGHGNQELSKDLYEGDIILTPVQWAQARAPKGNLLRLQATTDATKLWTPIGRPVIPYSFVDGFPDHHKEYIIADSLKFWEDRTCITFRPAVETMRIIKFNHDATNCSSAFGMAGGNQSLNLGPDCFTIGTITHELSHAFGTLHVHTRADRDEYIEVVEDNIKADMKKAFEKDSPSLGMSNYNIPYEFGSLMHYDYNSGAINSDNPTLRARDPYSQYQGTMGSPLASFYDVLLINKMYKCTRNCKTKIKCENNGVQDANKCMQCFCPKGWAGARCKIRPHDADVIELTENLVKDMEVDPVGYGYDQKLYVIEWMDCGSNTQFVEIVPTKDTRINGIRFCGEPDPMPIESDSNQMLVWMYNERGGRLSIQMNFTLFR